MTPAQATAIANDLDLVWGLFEGLKPSRTFRKALQDALTRAMASNWAEASQWPAGDARALALGTMIYAELMAGRNADPYSKRWSDAFQRTQAMLAACAGYAKDQTPQAVIDSTKATALYPILSAIASSAPIPAASLSLAAWNMGHAQKLVNECLQRSEFGNLARRHALAAHWVGAHLEQERAAKKQIDWTPAELTYLSALENAQTPVATTSGQVIGFFLLGAALIGTVVYVAVKS